MESGELQKVESNLTEPCTQSPLLSTDNEVLKNNAIKLENNKTFTDSSEALDKHILAECSEHSYCLSSSTIKNSDSAESVDEVNNTNIATVKKEPCIQNNSLSETNEGFSDGFVSSMMEVVDSVEVKDNDLEETAGSDSDSSESDSDESSSSTDTSSDDSCTIKIRHEDIELAEEVAALKNMEPPKVKGEILSSELPPVEEINISLPENSFLDAIGRVSQIMKDHSVIVKSYENRPALDFKTILFFARELAFGVVDETFGPVTSPYYVVRFNDEEHRISNGVELEREVFYAPQIKDFTSFVFVSQLKLLRGSDASWSNDTEPPQQCVEYSDDEQEREARKQRKNRANAQNENSETKSCSGTSNVTKGRGRGRKRDHWHNESTRVNVMNADDVSQEGWQNAVYRRTNQGTNLPPHASTLFNCFRSPPPTDFSGYAGGPFGPPVGPFNHHHHHPPPPPPPGHYEQQAHFMNWNHQARFRQPPPTFGYGRPPPPPPPT